MTRFIHFPANPDKFEFDEQVATIFPDMAVRSIPLYEETHRLAVKLVAREYYRAVAEDRTLRVLDIGASTGTFFKGLWRYLGYRVEQSIPNLEAVAIDRSYYMCERMHLSLPEVRIEQFGTEDVRSLVEHEPKFDVVVALYVFQFIPLTDDKRASAIVDVYDSMAEDSLMVLANKERVPDPTEQTYSNIYREFRLDNGYTLEEINAKTKALAGSMWTQDREGFNMWLTDTGFDEVTELCRWLQFASYLVYKRRYHG